MLGRSCIVALLWILAIGPAAPAARLPSPVEDAIQQVTPGELRAHVSVLASDKLAGRGVGHAGNHEAENYIAAALRKSNVPPAVPGYFQSLEVYQPRLGHGARLVVRDGDDAVTQLGVGSDFLPLPESSDSPATGPVVFAGHGLSAPELGHDDYSGIKASGALVLALDGVPDALAPSLSSDDKSEIGGIDRKVHDARAHGATGLLVIRSYPGSAGYLWPEHASVRSANYRLYEEMRAHPLAVAALSEKAAGAILHVIQQGRTVTGTLAPDVIARPITIDNVLGIIEGTRASGEVVVVGAHMDHDGIDETGRIYNGADDNASGTAAVLAVASAFVRAAARGSHPARTVVFALWNGEEKGSLGAEFYLKHPAPARTIVADINLDMVGREEEIPDPDNPRYRGFAKTSAAENRNVVHLLGYSYSADFARMAQEANEAIHLTIKEDYDRDAQNLVRRSDNWPFLVQRIPAVFLTTGLHPDYHTPEDDTGRIDFPKLQRITELAARLAWMAADGDAPHFTAR